LKAELYEKEQAVKRFKSGDVGATQPTARRGSGSVKDVFARSNRGVDERSKRDEAAHVSQNELERSRARLEEKASLYQRMARSEETRYATETDTSSERAPLVDFQLKSWQADVYERGQTTFDSQLQSTDTRHERERRKWEADFTAEAAREAARAERRENLDTVIAATTEGREAARTAAEQRLQAQRARLQVVQQKARLRAAAVAASRAATAAAAAVVDTDAVTSTTVEAHVSTSNRADVVTTSATTPATNTQPQPPPPPPPTSDVKEEVNVPPPSDVDTFASNKRKARDGDDNDKRNE
jgi:hypothetical protein